jgi:hypothetical protein
MTLVFKREKRERKNTKNRERGEKNVKDLMRENMKSEFRVL